MPRYELFGRALSSGMALPELPEVAASTPAAWRFERRLPAPAGESWFVIWWRPDGDPWVRACRTAAGYRIQYCNCAEFDVDLDHATIAGETIDCREEMFRHFLVDQVVPLIVSLEAPVLHASAVAIDGRLVAFTGPGGAGKSTLATALVRRGHAIGTDDALRVDARDAAVTAVPAYPGVRLWDDSEREVAAGLAGSGRTAPVAKQRFAAGLRAMRGEATLSQVYILDPASARTIAFAPLSRRDAVIELLRETYRLALDDRGARAREFEAIAAIASRVPCWRLSFPRRFDEWRTLAAEVESHAVALRSDSGVPAVDSRLSAIGRRPSDIGRAS
jgi:hypothetical protein